MLAVPRITVLGRLLRWDGALSKPTFALMKRPQPGSMERFSALSDSR